MKPLIYAKSSMDHEQIQAKLNIGCDGIEVQLLGELYKDKSKHIYNKVEDVWNLSEFDKYPIKSVHSPLTKEGDVLLEMICDLEDRLLFEELFRFTQHFADVQGINIPLIIHSESFYKALSDLGTAWINIRNSVKTMLSKYPNVILLIENVTPLRGIDKGEMMHLCNNCTFDNVEMVKRLREEIGTDRIGTVLDTCHAMMTEKYMTALYNETNRFATPDLTIQNYIEKNAPYCGIIHLCNFKGSGYGEGFHGTPFDEESYNLLCEILLAYEKFGCRCPLTLEVFEYDYIDSGNYALEKSYVEKYFNEY